MGSIPHNVRLMTSFDEKILKNTKKHYEKICLDDDIVFSRNDCNFLKDEDMDQNDCNNNIREKEFGKS